jgi:ribonuclease-3
MDRRGGAAGRRCVSRPSETLRARVGYSFHRPELLGLAVVHRSSRARAGENNEQLEFLGDAVLDLAISDLLMSRFPRADEGELSKRRAALVNARVLADKAAAIGLGDELHLGKGEEKSGGRTKPSILAAVYEAIIGAVYLDGGFEAARDLVSSHFEKELRTETRDSPADHKSRLQEVAQRLFRQTPTYTLVDASGPDHDRAFVAEIRIGGRLYGRGQGKSKKQAQQEAALQALADIETERKPAR